MKEKSEVFTKFKEWKAEVENLTGRKIKILRSDNGGEYKDSKFLEFCKSEGVKRHFTVKKMPQQNGVVSAYDLIPNDERTKLKPKALECIFLGFESGVKSFKL
ncbi:unnamed protein product [Prunus armeniaca]